MANNNLSLYRNIVILTGAGISAESGIAVFRSETGLWENHKVEDVATPEGFMRNPSLVHKFYNDRRADCQRALPNEAHKSIARLQEYYASQGGEVFLVTQNVDNLHERGGSSQVCHMHGELFSILCSECGYRHYFDASSSTESVCPKCSHKTLRPDIVWFGEMPYFMDEIYEKIQRCTLFIAVGTSGVVYPAAGFCQYAKSVGASTMELNLNPTNVTGMFDFVMKGRATDTVNALANALIDGQSLSDICR